MFLKGDTKVRGPLNSPLLCPALPPPFRTCGGAGGQLGGGGEEAQADNKVFCEPKMILKIPKRYVALDIFNENLTVREK